MVLRHMKSWNSWANPCIGLGQ